MEKGTRPTLRPLVQKPQGLDVMEKCDWRLWCSHLLSRKGWNLEGPFFCHSPNPHAALFPSSPKGIPTGLTVAAPAMTRVGT